MAISGIGSIPEIGSLSGKNQISKVQERDASFQDMLTNAISQADQLYQVTEADTQALLAGEVDDVAQVMVNSTKAEVALDLVVQVRNKIVDAYNEFMRMQV